MFYQYIINAVSKDSVFDTLEEAIAHAKSGDKIYLYECEGGYDFWNTLIVSTQLIVEVA